MTVCKNLEIASLGGREGAESRMGSFGPGCERLVCLLISANTLN